MVRQVIAMKTMLPLAEGRVIPSDLAVAVHKPLTIQSRHNVIGGEIRTKPVRQGLAEMRIKSHRGRVKVARSVP